MILAVSLLLLLAFWVANISQPSTCVEFREQLSNLRLRDINLKCDYAFDWKLVRADTTSDPSPSDLVTIIKVTEGL